jgi:hypothetical protein
MQFAIVPLSARSAMRYQAVPGMDHAYGSTSTLQP